MGMLRMTMLRSALLVAAAGTCFVAGASHGAGNQGPFRYLAAR